METYQGICRYCGEIQPVMAVDQVDADNKISDTCACGGATTEKRRKAMNKNIEKICGSGAVGCGFYEVEPYTREIINKAAEAVLLGHISAAGLELEDSTLSIKETKGKTRIQRKRPICASAES
ncbi:MAG: hypothetical protein PHX63_07435 [Eubacteriales bacterium]|nr:hypothetical protein [Eubacteriales bacterium]